MRLRKRMPTSRAQIEYHLSQERGTWEIPLTTFQTTRDGIRPEPVRGDMHEPLVVPERLSSVEAATAEHQRAVREAIFDRGVTRGMREVLVPAGALAAAVIGPIVVNTLTMSDDLTGLEPYLLLLFFVMPVVAFGSFGAWFVFGAPNRDLEVSQGVWDERVRLYDERIEELRRPKHVDDAASAVRGRGSAGWYVSWGRER